MIDASQVDAFAARLNRAGALIDPQADPILSRHGRVVAEKVEEYAPKRTSRPPRSTVQIRPGVVSASPYLVGAYRGTSVTGPNRRFMKAALDDVARPFVRDVGALAVRVLGVRR